MERAIRGIGGGRMERDLSRPRVQFIYLHHVLADE
jgi:hypothetical protein